MVTDRTTLIKAAIGEQPLDLVIENTNLVNVFTCEIYPADIGILGERIALVQQAGRDKLLAHRVIDGCGKWAVPGFVDTHVHIESTNVTPANYAAAVLPFGTTTVVIDPHDIANVMGMDAVRYMIRASENIPLRVYLTIPPCVPAVPGLETCGAEFTDRDVKEMLAWPRVVGIAEVMDYLGVLKGDPRMVDVVQAGLSAGVAVEGHSPMITGRELNAYIAAGIQSDHEVVGAADVLEKLRLGNLPLVRKRTVDEGDPVPHIARLLQSLRYADVALCTDDIAPALLLAEGHLNSAIRGLILNGLDPALAYRYASFCGAQHFGLRDLGAIAPGFLADIVLLDSLESVTASEVIVGGEFIVSGGKLVCNIHDPSESYPWINSVRLPELSADSFRIRAPIQEGVVGIRVLMKEEKIWSIVCETHSVRVYDGVVSLESLGDDVCLLSIVPRHGQGHPPSLVPFKGFGLNRGAIATTVSHDSQNIVVTGVNPNDMLLAVKCLEKCGGGIVAVSNGQVLGLVELPIAGLISSLPVPQIADQFRKFNSAAAELGIQTDNPLGFIGSLAIPVLPASVRLTDLGLVDYSTHSILPYFV